MVENVEKLIEWLETIDAPHFIVKSKENNDNSKVFETREDESFEDAKARFRRVMEIVTGRRFFVVARKDFKSTRGFFTEELSNNPDGAGQAAVAGMGSVAAQGMPGVGYVAVGELERRLADERKAIMQDVKIERLEAENADLRAQVKEKDDIAHRFMKKLDPVIGHIAGSIAGKLVPGQPMLGVAGIEVQESDETQEYAASEEDQMRLATALERWAKAEPDFLRVVETLADMAERGDQMYIMAKNMIIR